jgi:hypothetical protein
MERIGNLYRSSTVYIDNTEIIQLTWTKLRLKKWPAYAGHFSSIRLAIHACRLNHHWRFVASFLSFLASFFSFGDFSATFFSVFLASCALLMMHSLVDRVVIQHLAPDTRN